MLILVLLGMYFDAAVVFVLTFIQIGCGHTVINAEKNNSLLCKLFQGIQ